MKKLLRIEEKRVGYDAVLFATFTGTIFGIFLGGEVFPNMLKIPYSGESVLQDIIVWGLILGSSFFICFMTWIIERIKE